MRARDRRLAILGLAPIAAGILAGWAVLGAGQATGGNVADLGRLIPRTVLDWQAVGEDQTYDTRTLYDYLDGGAEVYLAFDLDRVFVRKYRGPSGDEIALDIYALRTPEEAFGVFSSDRQDPGVGIGQESEYGLGLLRFRQGRFFVSITASGDEKRSEAAMLTLGRAVVPALGAAGGIPALLANLPDAGLVPGRTSFFHSVVNLNNRFFVSSENVLDLDKSTDCVLAEYTSGGAETAKLLLVRYPDAARAARARQSFGQALLGEGQAAGAVRNEKGAWTAVKLEKDFLAVVFDAPSRDFAASLLAAVKFPAP